MIEVLVGIVVSLILGWGVFLALGSCSAAMAAINAQGTLQVQLTLAANAFTQDLHLTNGLVEDPFNGFIPELNGDGMATLILQAPAIDGADQPLDGGAVDTIIYTFDGTENAGPWRGMLRRIVIPAPGSSRPNTQETPAIVARDLTQVTFQPFETGPSGGGIAMMLTGELNERGRTFRLRTTATATTRMF